MYHCVPKYKNRLYTTYYFIHMVLLFTVVFPWSIGVFLKKQKKTGSTRFGAAESSGAQYVHHACFYARPLDRGPITFYLVRRLEATFPELVPRAASRPVSPASQAVVPSMPRSHLRPPPVNTFKAPTQSANPNRSLALALQTQLEPHGKQTNV